MSKPLVSIILPVYNAQNHIARCLESICAQSWQNIEVIVLNDGSKDQSLPVCEAFRAKDERIVLVDKYLVDALNQLWKSNIPLPCSTST